MILPKKKKKLETDYKAEMIRFLNSLPNVVKAERVENSTSIGNPDITIYLTNKDKLEVEVKRWDNDLSPVQANKHNMYKYSYVVYFNQYDELALYEKANYKKMEYLLIYLTKNYKNIKRPIYKIGINDDDNKIEHRIDYRIK